MIMGRNKNLTFEKAQEFLERSRQIREEINLLNEEMCQLMKWNYTPPRGFNNPFVKTEDDEVKRTKIKTEDSSETEDFSTL